MKSNFKDSSPSVLRNKSFKITHAVVLIIEKHHILLTYFLQQRIVCSNLFCMLNIILNLQL